MNIIKWLFLSKENKNLIKIYNKIIKIIQFEEFLFIQKKDTYYLFIIREPGQLLFDEDRVSLRKLKSKCNKNNISIEIWVEEMFQNNSKLKIIESAKMYIDKLSKDI